MIIISRFEEGVDHLSWLKDYPHIIYNRGPAIVPPDSNASDANLHSLRTVDVLDNVGRESFIYLSHIVHRYHKLHEINIFSQAEQRVPTVPSYDDNCFKKDVEDLVAGNIAFVPENDGFLFLIPACEHAYNLIYAKYFEKRYGESVSLFSSGFKDLLNYESANPIRFTPTALFAVRKETILRNPREYYINLARTMS
eukprot:gene31950-41445_t